MAKKTGTKDEVIKKLGAEAPASPFAETIAETAVPKPAAEAGSVEPRKPRVFKVKQNLEPPVIAEPVKRRAKKAPVDPFQEVATTAKEEKKPRAIRAKAKPAKEESVPVTAPPTETTAKTVKKKKAGVTAAKAVASPSSRVKKKRTAKKVAADVTTEIAAAVPDVPVSKVFKALSDVKLPELKKDNRAQLLLQSPTRIYFYWSVRENPWRQLRNAFGQDLGSYSLVLKLTDVTNGIESIFPAEPHGERWFDVEADTEYKAEIGFYAPNRPYFRIVYSNKVATPRRSPSPHPASDARWTVTANKFAEVLDVSGFTRDAFDVAMAGDDIVGAADATNLAFSTFVGGGDYRHFAAEDIRYAMLSIAAGVQVEELRARVSSRLFATLAASASDPTPEKSRAALKDHFDLGDIEWTEETLGAAVHGESLVHFPKTLKTRRAASTYRPLSSHSLR